ncbi:MAG: hypothetical protein ACD_28C00311G0001 [uncultured bacterium]|nr:MAG: hypothetical protein ACD_28C00311G0001 [uncultured bacterium]
MIVGIYGFIASLWRAQNFIGSIGNDLIGIHVVRSPGTGLKHIESELIIEFSINELLGGLINGLGFFCAKLFQL